MKGVTDKNSEEHKKMSWVVSRNYVNKKSAEEDMLLNAQGGSMWVLSHICLIFLETELISVEFPFFYKE